MPNPDPRSASHRGLVWAMVLAASEDHLVRSATASPAEFFVPPQYRPLYPSHITPLQAALRRAKAVTSRQKLVVVATSEHRQWWRNPVWFVPASNIVAQPKRLGATSSVLLALLTILARDPAARVLVLPSTHRVRDEDVFMRGIRDTAARIVARSEEISLLGVQPESVDVLHPCVILGRRESSGAFEVTQLIDRPGHQLASDFAAGRVLWNSGVMGGAAWRLLRPFERRWPRLVEQMRAVIRGEASEDSLTITAADSGVQPTDSFHQLVLTDHKRLLRVVPGARCGWSDLNIVETQNHASFQPATLPLLTGPSSSERRII